MLMTAAGALMTVTGAGYDIARMRALGRLAHGMAVGDLAAEAVTLGQMSLLLLTAGTALFCIGLLLLPVRRD